MRMRERGLPLITNTHITIRVYMEYLAVNYINKFLKNIAINLAIGLKLIDAEVGDD